MIYDCFPFFNELELLEIRLRELSDVVDKFVLVEATKTHSGLDKPLYYLQNRSRFLDYFDKIIHIVVKDMPMTPAEVQASISVQDRKWLDTGYQMGDNWCRERFQRNAMLRGLTECSPDDIIIISDADEIVRASTVEYVRDRNSNDTYAVSQGLYAYYLNFKCINMPWQGSKILKYKYVTNPSEHRFHTIMNQNILEGGWHFGFLGGAERIKQKIQSYAHQEFNVPDVLNNVEERLKLGKDVLGRLYEYRFVPIDESYPKYVYNNQDLFQDFIYKE